MDKEQTVQKSHPPAHYLPGDLGPGPYRAHDPAHQTQEQRIESLRAKLAEKRAANEALPNACEPHEEETLTREIAIEDARASAFAAGLIEAQLITCDWPGIGKCLFRTPSEVIYGNFVKTSGMLRGELVNDLAVHERLAAQCALEPDGKTFLELARKYNPHAPVQVGGAMLKRMGDRALAEGK